MQIFETNNGKDFEESDISDEEEYYEEEEDDVIMIKSNERIISGSNREEESSLQMSETKSDFVEKSSTKSQTQLFHACHIDEKKTSNQEENVEPLLSRKTTAESPFEYLIPEGVSGEEKDFYNKLFTWMKDHGGLPNKIPIMGFKTLDLYNLYIQVTQQGGFDEVNRKVTSNAFDGLWVSIFRKLRNYKSTITNSAVRLRKYYQKYLLAYERAHFVPPPSSDIVFNEDVKKSPKQKRSPSIDHDNKNIVTNTGLISSINNVNNSNLSVGNTSTGSHSSHNSTNEHNSKNFVSPKNTSNTSPNQSNDTIEGIADDFTPVILRFFAKESDQQLQSLISHSKRNSDGRFASIHASITQANSAIIIPTPMEDLYTLEEANQSIRNGTHTAEQILYTSNKFPVLEIHAKVNNHSPTGRAILSELPLQQTVNTFGQLLYFLIPPITRKPGVKTEKKMNSKDYVERGELVHWEEGGAVCLPWGKTGVSQEEEEEQEVLIIKDLDGKCKLVEACTIFGRCERLGCTKYEVNGDGLIVSREGLDAFAELDHIKDGYLVLMHYDDGIPYQSHTLPLHERPILQPSPPQQNKKHVVNNHSQHESTVPVSNGVNHISNKMHEEQANTTSNNIPAIAPINITGSNSIKRRRRKNFAEEERPNKQMKLSTPTSPMIVPSNSLSTKQNTPSPQQVPHSSLQSQSSSSPIIDSNRKHKKHNVIPSAAPLPSNFKEVIVGDTDVENGGKTYNVVIKYKYEGEREDDSRLLKRQFQFLSDAKKSPEINGKNIMHLLKQDHVDVDQMEEVRYYEYGSDDDSSGWVLMGDSYRCRLNGDKAKDNGKTKIKLQLKPTFEKTA